MLEVRGLTQRYSGIPVVQDVSFTIRRGEILGYPGPNGAGKSTTVKVPIGLIEATSGSVELDGRNVRDDMKAFRRRIGYVPDRRSHPGAVEFRISHCDSWSGRNRTFRQRNLRRRFLRSGTKHEGTGDSRGSGSNSSGHCVAGLCDWR